MTRQRLRATAPTLRTRIPAAPLEVRTPHPKAWAQARALAKGDLSRLVVQRDGSVLVKNPPPG